MTRVQHVARVGRRERSAGSHTNHSKRPLKVVLESITQEKKKFRTVASYNAEPPAGYLFVPVGYPDLTEFCKKRCSDQNLQFQTVNAKPKNKANLDPDTVSHHIHRVGNHFPADIVQQGCTRLGYWSPSSGVFKKYNVRLEERLAKHKGKEGKEQTRSAIQELFPKLPAKDLREIIHHAFKKGSMRVGNAEDMPLIRKVQLAVSAHARHNYTDYDKLLRQVSWEQARALAEQPTLNQLKAWRGEDTDVHETEEVFRELIIIDSDSEDDTDDESDESDVTSGDRDTSVEFVSYATYGDDPAARARPTGDPTHHNAYIAPSRQYAYEERAPARPISGFRRHDVYGPLSSAQAHDASYAPFQAPEYRRSPHRFPYENTSPTTRVSNDHDWQQSNVLSAHLNRALAHDRTYTDRHEFRAREHGELLRGQERESHPHFGHISHSVSHTRPHTPPTYHQHYEVTHTRPLETHRGHQRLLYEETAARPTKQPTPDVVLPSIESDASSQPRGHNDEAPRARVRLQTDHNGRTVLVEVPEVTTRPQIAHHSYGLESTQRQAPPLKRKSWAESSYQDPTRLASKRFQQDLRDPTTASASLPQREVIDLTYHDPLRRQNEIVRERYVANPETYQSHDSSSAVRSKPANRPQGARPLDAAMWLDGVPDGVEVIRQAPSERRYPVDSFEHYREDNHRAANGAIYSGQPVLMKDTRTLQNSAQLAQHANFGDWDNFPGGTGSSNTHRRLQGRRPHTTRPRYHDHDSSAIPHDQPLDYR